MSEHVRREEPLDAVARLLALGGWMHNSGVEDDAVEPLPPALLPAKERRRRLANLIQFCDIERQHSHEVRPSRR